MGEVYRARDTKLKRDVAIKTLPEEFSHDPDRLNRFQREAEVLASLNHPNIAAIYDLQEAEGSRFLVLELVEGETLADRIARGPIPIDEALPIAKSICEALEAAHEQGIIHRDLKPANIKITTDGKVKVLDFGLAKIREAGPATNFSHSPTLLSGSVPGVIIGTAAYMSPEQAKGEELDRRTDIFSFGAVLYEMLTGKQAFSGDSVTQILARILEREPDWSLLPANVQPGIRKLLRLCLEKAARRRRSDAADVRIDIEQSANEPSEPATSSPISRKSERLWMSAAAALLVVAAILSVVAIRSFRGIPAPEIRTEIVTPATTDPFSFALSPDGHQIVYVASGDGAPRLWLRVLSGTTASPLAGTEGAAYPFWSPDSRSVGFFTDGKLKRVDIGGGLPQTLATAGGGRGGTWGVDGVILYAPSTSGSLYRVAASGGQATPVTKPDPSQPGHRFPQFLPDGRHFLFYAQGGPENQGIYIGSLDSFETKRVTAADTAGLYAAPGLLLFVRQGTLLARTFDPVRGELRGDPVTVADTIGVSNFAGALSTSSTGLIAYRVGRATRTQLVWFDRTGKTIGTVGDPDETIQAPELSPDGKRVAVDRDPQNNRDVWVIDLQRGGTTRFTFEASIDWRPLWSPDGTQIVFDSNRKKAATDLYTKPSTGAGTEQLILESPYTKTPDGWSPDGHFLLYNENNGKTSDVLALPLQGDRKPIPVANSPFSENNGQFSPDGRWVAYQSNESGRFEIYAVPFPPGAGKWQVSTNGGIAPRWRHDGRELFFIGPDGQMMAAGISTPGSSIEAATPVVLFQTRIAGGSTNPAKQQYAVSADGRFLINTIGNSPDSPITLLQNWKPPKQ
jgi:serine/threonine protein kinase/Tol biopolymer transport system component